MIAEKFIHKTKDDSLISEFTTAVNKIKSVLGKSERQKSNFLAERTIIGKNWDNERMSSYLSEIQKSLTNYTLLRIAYQKEGESNPLIRTIEPFAIYSNTSENWVLIAWCRLRDDFRTFRIDRITRLTILSEKFSPHEISLQEYVDRQKKNILKICDIGLSHLRFTFAINQN